MNHHDAWSTEDGEVVVVGTHDRIAGLIAAQRCLREEIDFNTANPDWAGIPSTKIWVRPDWDTCDENDPIITNDPRTGVPALFFRWQPEQP